MRSAARLLRPGPCPLAPLPPPGRFPLPRWPRVEPTRYGGPWRVSTGAVRTRRSSRASPRGSAGPSGEKRVGDAAPGPAGGGRAAEEWQLGERRARGAAPARRGGRQPGGRAAAAGRGRGEGSRGGADQGAERIRGRGEGARRCWPRAARAHLPARPTACRAPSVLAAQVAGPGGPGLRARGPRRWRRSRANSGTEGLRRGPRRAGGWGTGRAGLLPPAAASAGAGGGPGPGARVRVLHRRPPCRLAAAAPRTGGERGARATLRGPAAPGSSASPRDARATRSFSGT